MEKDLKLAFDHFVIASELGLGAAQYQLGVCYFNGQGVQQDLNTAAELLLKAKAKGCIPRTEADDDEEEDLSLDWRR